MTLGQGNLNQLTTQPEHELQQLNQPRLILNLLNLQQSSSLPEILTHQPDCGPLADHSPPEDVRPAPTTTCSADPPAMNPPSDTRTTSRFGRRLKSTQQEDYVYNLKEGHVALCY